MTIQPIIHGHLTQIFVKHYKLANDKAAEEALRFYEILHLYGLDIIDGEWLVPEAVVERPKDAWQIALEKLKEVADREPWLAREIQ